MNEKTDPLVMLAAGLLIGALVVTRKLLAELPKGTISQRWRALSIMIFVALIGYVAYLLELPIRDTQLKTLATPMVFFLGSCIVLIVVMMSLETVHDVRRMAVLEIETITDPLTQLFNRRYFTERLRAEIGRAHRHGLPLSLLLMDLDNFKDINDTFGHPVGDEVLLTVAKLCTSAVRSEDMVARYGGDEIAIIAPDSDAAHTTMLAERLRSTIQDTALLKATTGDGPQDVRVTLSIGLATLRDDSEDADALIKRADKAMYESKHVGRNRVSVSG